MNIFLALSLLGLLGGIVAALPSIIAVYMALKDVPPDKRASVLKELGPVLRSARSKQVTLGRTPPPTLEPAPNSQAEQAPQAPGGQAAEPAPNHPAVP